MCPLRRIGSLLSCAGLLLVVGCGVEETRVIGFSADGKSTSFQHGTEGIFVTAEPGGELQKIFQPDVNVIASSTPLWAPQDKRLIFTTARRSTEPATPLAPQVQTDADGWDNNPTGRRFSPCPIIYTCWLRAESEAGLNPEPVALFEAKCDHPGYVAANLAVRWHPTENRVLYLDSAQAGLHSVFEFEISSQETRQVFPHLAAALVFDWNPAGTHLVCCAHGNQGESRDADGIWMGQPETAEWWQIPESAEFEESGPDSNLQVVQQLRPSWTADGAHFAFVHRTQNLPAGTAAQPELRHGTIATREVELLLKLAEPISELRWSPQGSRLAFIQGEKAHELHVIDCTDPAVTPLPAAPQSKRVSQLDAEVRSCAGWDAAGEQLAYVVVDNAHLPEAEIWTGLLIPARGARDAILITDAAGKEPGVPVFSGMRVTFPNWSPALSRLSFWATFAPAYQSVPTLTFGGGLRLGDPAAVLDLTTRELTWMPINPIEKAQIGHYQLLQGDPETAEQWYLQAEQGLPAQEFPAHELPVPDNSRRNFYFFRYVCLSRLGKSESAALQLARFRATFRQPPNVAAGTPTPQSEGAEDPVVDPAPVDVNPAVLGLAALSIRIPQDFYIAEVYLSLNSVAEGVSYFRQELQLCTTETDRLSSALALSQLLLVQRKHPEYAELVTETLVPAFAGFWKDAYAELPQLELQSSGWLGIGLPQLTSLALLPLYAPEFVGELPPELLRQLIPQWEQVGLATDSHTTRLGVDLFLHEAYLTLDRDADQQAVAERINQNPVRAKLLPAGGMPQALNQFREFRRNGLTP